MICIRSENSLAPREGKRKEGQTTHKNVGKVYIMNEHSASPLAQTTYSAEQQQDLHSFATRYIWWQRESEALHYPERVLAQVMNLGTIEDISRLLTSFTSEQLMGVIEHAEPGWFTERSWAFWHYRLDMATLSSGLPPLPIRSFSTPR